MYIKRRVGHIESKKEEENLKNEKKKENVKFSQSMSLLIYIFRQNNKRDYSKNDLRLYMGAYTTT